jgi:hypothetical protein
MISDHLFSKVEMEDNYVPTYTDIFTLMIEIKSDIAEMKGKVESELVRINPNKYGKQSRVRKIGQYSRNK